MRKVICLLLVSLCIVTGCLQRNDADDGLTIHFIDVGQGDSILIQNGRRGVLIDGGEENVGVLPYLQSLQISGLDYVIGTHPHSDHIGGLAEVIDALPVEHVIMPRVDSNTMVYEKLLRTIKSKNLRIHAPTPGETITLTVELTKSGASGRKSPDDFSMIFLAPNNDVYEDTNNHSIVVKLVYGGLSFLFTGDAEDVSEADMLVHDLSADVLKVGHHGSNSSTSDAFLQAVDPRIAVISVGMDNMYGHPHQEVLERLSNGQMRIYRTDEDGTIVMKTDGETIYGR